MNSKRKIDRKWKIKRIQYPILRKTQETCKMQYIIRKMPKNVDILRMLIYNLRIELIVIVNDRRLQG